MTPEAASNPKAEPPASTTAWTLSTRLTGLSRSVSRVPGALPRTSTPPTAPFRHKMTVQPVRAPSSWACPTSIPGMSVIPLNRIMALSSNDLSRYYILTWIQPSFQAMGQFQEFIPLFFKEMDGDIVQFKVVSGLSVRFGRFPGQVVLGLGQGIRLGFELV